MTTPLPSAKTLLLIVMGLLVGSAITVAVLTYFTIKVAGALLECIPQREAPSKPEPKQSQRL